MFPEHGFRLGGSIVQAEFLRGHGSLFQFFRIPDNNGKRNAGFSSNSRRRGDWEARMTGGIMGEESGHEKQGANLSQAPWMMGCQ